MENAALLSDFEGKVEEFAKYRSFIEKTSAQKGKFSAKVVEKIIKDNTEKSMAVVETLIPLLSDIEEVIEALRGRRAEIVEGAESSRFSLDVLELKHVIGELEQPDFDQQSGALKVELTEIDASVATLEAELGRFVELQERWNQLGTEAGVYEAAQ